MWGWKDVRIVGDRLTRRAMGAGPIAVMLLAFVVCGVLVVADGFAALAVVVVAAAVVFLSRWSGAVPIAMLVIVFAQPLLLRIAPQDSTGWIWLKRFDEVALAACLPFAVLRLVNEGKPGWPRWTTIGLGGGVLIGVIGARLSYQPSWFLMGLDAFLLFKGFLVFIIVRAYPVSFRGLRYAFIALGGFAAIAALVGVVEFLAPDAVRSVLPLLTDTGYRGGRAVMVSIFEHEGQTGWFFGAMTAVCLAIYHVRRNGWYVVLATAATVCSVLTLRRKPMLGIAVVLVVLFVASRKGTSRARNALVSALVVILVVLAFGDFLVPVFQSGYEHYFQGPATDRVARNAMYLASVRIAFDYFPFGVGFGLFGGFTSQLEYSPVLYDYGLSDIWGLSPRYSGWVTDAFWPHVLGEFGVLGFALYSIAMVAIWRPLWRPAREHSDPRARALALAAVLVWVEAMVESAASPIFESSLSAFFVFAAAGFATRFAVDGETTV